MAEMIQFTITPPTEAIAVILKGEWDGWAETNLKRKKDGSWYTRKKVPEGVWQFGFLCDGQWLINPLNPKAVSPFGTENNVVTSGGDL